MKNLIFSKALQQKMLLLTVLFLLVGGVSSAQQVYTHPNNAPQTAPTPLVKQTGVTRERIAPGKSPSKKSKSPLYNLPEDVDTGAPVSDEVDVFTPDAVQQATVSGMRGILVETADGRQLQENASNIAFNPASNVKLITTLAALKRFGPNFRLPTGCWTDGTLDLSTGILYGNLIISGQDYSFNSEHAVNLANELNKRGIRSVTGDLLVAPTFTMNYNPSAINSARALFSTLDAARRSAASNRSWQSYLIASGKYNPAQMPPSVAITGSIYVETMPTNARLLFTHESAPLRDLLKSMLCYSNNFMAEHLGNLIGGADAVGAIARFEANIPYEELHLASTSGLGLNRVTPRAMMRVLRGVVSELSKYKMNLTDICPVAGVDVGTLERRQTIYPYRGSVVGKTGTLPNTDGGVSTLVGQLSTNQGTLYFVIFNQRSGVNRSRAFQDDLLVQLANQNGGAKPFAYSVLPLSTRMANINIRNGQPPLTAIKLLN